MLSPPKFTVGIELCLAWFPYRVNREDVLKNGHAAVVHVITMNGIESLKKIHYKSTTKVHMSCVLYSKSPEDIQWLCVRERKCLLKHFSRLLVVKFEKMVFTVRTYCGNNIMVQHIVCCLI